VITAEQNAQHQRRERIRRKEPAHFRREKFERVFARQYENELRRRELDKDRSENEKDARVLGKGSRLIDPQLHDRGREKEERDHEIFGGLRLLSAENQKRKASDERSQDNDFDITRSFKTTE
jgi:hypothetical protein